MMGWNNGCVNMIWGCVWKGNKSGQFILNNNAGQEIQVPITITILKAIYDMSEVHEIKLQRIYDDDDDREWMLAVFHLI